jgi:capsular exopolysaccharide synthesis family protein
VASHPGWRQRAVPAAPDTSPPWNELADELVSLLHPTSVEAEQYRALRYTVEHLARASGLRILAISSAGARDGKTTTALNLAGALAQAPEARVLLVEADLRRAMVGQYLGVNGAALPGLVDAIVTPDLTLDQVIQRRPPYNLSVILAGSTPSAPYEVLKSPRLGELLLEARQRFDYVILDTPPIVPVPDTRVIGKWVDGFVVVVAADRTPRKLLEEALNLMEPSKLIGLVFNDDPRPLRSFYGYGYGYGTPARQRDGDRDWSN